jgi:hypothetical protein
MTMSKSTRRDVRKRVQKRVATIGGAIRNSRRNRGVSKKKIAAAAGAALAGAAWFVKRRGDGAENGLTTLHVLAADEGWLLQTEGSDESKTYPTKRKAVAAGREVAANAAPSNLVIHRRDGSVELSHAYAGENGAD